MSFSEKQSLYFYSLLRRIGLYTMYAGSYISPEGMKPHFGGFHGALPTRFGHAPTGIRKAANCHSIHTFQTITALI